jgi:hypothetical protein
MLQLVVDAPILNSVSTRISSGIGMIYGETIAGKNCFAGFADLGMLSVGNVDDKLKHIAHSHAQLLGA